MNGVVAGLVAITASCHLMTIPASMLIGVVGGLVCIWSTHLLERLQIDDAIGAVPAHLAAGIWGTLAVALLAPDGSWNNGHTRWEQLLVQAEGIAIIGAYSFGVSYVLLRLINRWLPLRVGVAEERIGLNISEHGASTAMLDLITQMDRQAREGDFRRPVEVEPETEAGRVARFYNAVLEKFHLESDRRHMALRTLHQYANYDPLTGLANRRMFLDAYRQILHRAAHNGSTGALLYLDLDGFKGVNDRLGHDAGDLLLKLASTRMTHCIRKADLLARLGGDEFAVVLDAIDGNEGAARVAQKLVESLQEPFDLGGETGRIGVSVGIAMYGPGHFGTAKVMMHDADQAMYQAKLAGKGTYRFAETSGSDELAPAG